jgi:phosphoribosylaminoimidazole (AIR) synthetase
MGCGFCCVVPSNDTQAAVALLSAHHPGTRVIGSVTGAAGAVELSSVGLRGTRAGFESSQGG